MYLINFVHAVNLFIVYNVVTNVLDYINIITVIGKRINYYLII